MALLALQISNPRFQIVKICNLRFSATRRLLPTFHRGKVVVHGTIGLKAPDRALFFPFTGENRFQERSDLLPRGFGLGGAKPSRHGVVQKTVRRVGINAKVDAVFCRGENGEQAPELVGVKLSSTRAAYGS